MTTGIPARGKWEGGASLAVVGAGPAGLTAAMQACRLGVETLLFEADRPGGFLLTAWRVENFPGFPRPLAGARIARLLLRQAEARGVVVSADRIEAVEPGPDRFRLTGRSGRYEAVAVILATGSRSRRLALPGAAALEGERLFYRADRLLERLPAPPSVLVIGGGEAAFDQALMVAGGGARVTLALRGRRDRALPEQAAAVRRAGIEVRREHRPAGLEKSGEIVAVSFHTDRGEERIETAAVLAAIGKEPDWSLVPAAAKGPGGEPATDLAGETALPGLYLAGDLRRGPHRQGAIAAGDGMAAALAAAAHIGRKGERRDGDHRST